MNWSKAKDIIIVLFLILNIILAFFLNKEKNKYTLSEEQCSMIYSILDKNNIIYENNFLLKNYKPMKQINAIYEPINLESIFCFFEYEKYEKKDNIEEMISNTINSLNIKNGKFVKDNKIYEDDNVILEYRQNYKKNIIYDNYIILKLNSKGLISVDYNYNNILKTFNKPREISSSEEIMLTFIQKIRSIYLTEKIKIEKMDIVYNKMNINNTCNKNIVMIPFYRIYYTVPCLNKDLVFVIMINAYTNTVY